jgi:N-acetylneuraminic acid mutarotase
MSSCVPLVPVYYNDLYRFSPAANTWTALSPSGSPPSSRQGMGFAAAPDGVLYVFGGQVKNGERTD